MLTRLSLILLLLGSLLSSCYSEVDDLLPDSDNDSEDEEEEVAIPVNIPNPPDEEEKVAINADYTEYTSTARTFEVAESSRVRFLDERDEQIAFNIDFEDSEGFQQFLFEGTIHGDQATGNLQTERGFNVTQPQNLQRIVTQQIGRWIADVEGGRLTNIRLIDESNQLLRSLQIEVEVHLLEGSIVQGVVYRETL